MSEELPRELSFLTRANVELAKATTLQEFKAIRDMAESARTLTKSRQLGLEIQAYAAEVKLLAERRTGQVLRKAMHLHGAGPPEKRESHHGTLLSEIKINKNQSARWQQEAAVPEAVFQRYLAEVRAAGKVPTSQGLLRVASRLQEDAAGGAPTLAKETPPGKSSVRSKVSDSSDSTAKTRSSRSANGESLLADLHGHQKQLSSLLKEFCGDKPVIKPNPIDRRYAAKLLGEMGEFLNVLRGQRENEMSREEIRQKDE